MPDAPDPLDQRVIDAPKKRRHSARRQIIEWIVVILAAALTAFGLRAQVVQAF